MENHKLAARAQKMNRLYAVESTPGLSGTVADHRLPMRADRIEGFVRSLAVQLGVEVDGGQIDAVNDVPAAWLAALVSDLTAHKGASLVIAGDGQPAVVHALVHAINRSLGNVGKTVEYVSPIEAEPVNQLASLRELVASMRNQEVELLRRTGRQSRLQHARRAGVRQALRAGQVTGPSLGISSTKRRSCRTGTYPPPITSNRGETRGRSTVRSRSSSH